MPRKVKKMKGGSMVMRQRKHPPPFVAQQNGDGFLGNVWNGIKKAKIISTVARAAGTAYGGPILGAVAGGLTSYAGLGKPRRGKATPRRGVLKF